MYTQRTYKKEERGVEEGTLVPPMISGNEKLAIKIIQLYISTEQNQDTLIVK